MGDDLKGGYIMASQGVSLLFKQLDEGSQLVLVVADGFEGALLYLLVEQLGSEEFPEVFVCPTIAGNSCYSPL